MKTLHKLCRPYIVHELPGWGYVLRALKKPGRRIGPDVTIRGKHHGLLMPLDLSDPVDQTAFFLGRFGELEVVLLLRQIIHQGDMVLDIGANRGHFMLLAASLVGQTGMVHAFEPNPKEAKRLDELISINGLDNCRIHQLALGVEPSTMNLRILDEKSGLATLADLGDSSEQRVTEMLEVRVERGDDLLAGELAEPLLVKIDVEGFEVNVLRGLEASLGQVKPLVILEVEPDWLERAGSSSQEIFDLMRPLGFEAFHIATSRSYLRHKLKLTPVEDAADLARVRGREGATYRNMAWAHPENQFYGRLTSLIP